ncbi:MAG: response regulator, partial [Myxococcota bacterium]
AARDAEPTSRPEAPRRGRVLVVDDNPINLKVACALVKSAGYDVGDAPNGARALELLLRERWDAVLMDCHMPEMDGYEATRRLRASGSTVPVIALTAAAMTDELEACRAAGMNECLTKPVNFGALKRALEQALRRGEGASGVASP